MAFSSASSWFGLPVQGRQPSGVLSQHPGLGDGRRQQYGRGILVGHTADRRLDDPHAQPQ
ncbi:hypothetical protein ACFYSF_48330 [Streptomyces canus]|uniref:hypothetical protein n=1 Tax=Streptomyces canus TaxID=58343 RepID=UPI0036983E48